MKTVQLFSDEYLENCRRLSANDIVRFLDQFRRLHGGAANRSRLISIKIPELLLESFKTKCELGGIRYQTQIKLLMQQWLEGKQGKDRT
jgi:predicted DNA binding CopG/RHH family protein